MSYRSNENIDIRVERWWETLMRRHLVTALFVASAALFIGVFIGVYRGRHVGPIFVGWVCEGVLVFVYSLFPATDRSKIFGRGVLGHFALLALLSAWWIWSTR